ncbi:MAG TPA: HTH domain-containing protein [Halobacteria archaeon]|jgi:hypothetical protein|nr:HTH domain-containing protein [Halobacteria archaeon]
MSEKLTLTQRDTLIALITLYREKGEAVSGDDIAAFIKRNPGTIRNQMQIMKALGLVEGVPGPKGGYKPTINAYKAINTDLSYEEATILTRKLEEKEINAKFGEEDIRDDILLSKIKSILSEIDIFLDDKIVREVTVTEILLWIWLCYQFELYEKGAKLFRKVNPEHSEIYKEIEMIGRICEGRVM